MKLFERIKKYFVKKEIDPVVNGYYFAPYNNRLRYGDDRRIVLEETHSVEGTIQICSFGLHCSRTAAEALEYAPSPLLYKVEAWGDIDEGSDKLAARNRKYTAVLNTSEILEKFNRNRALTVLPLLADEICLITYREIENYLINCGSESECSIHYNTMNAIAYKYRNARANDSVSISKLNSARVLRSSFNKNMLCNHASSVILFLSRTSNKKEVSVLESRKILNQMIKEGNWECLR